MNFKKNYPKKKYARKVVKRTKRTYAKKGISAFSVKRIVKMAIAKNVENKTFQYSAEGFNVYPSNATGFGPSIFPCSPYTSYTQIDQGVGQGQRIGNNIKIKSINFKGFVYPTPYDATTNTSTAPTYVVMRFFYVRATPATLPVNMSVFLQNGDGSSNLNNRLIDMSQDYNKDIYRVLCTRIFKIGTSFPVAAATNSVANNDFKYNQRFSINLTKHAVKKIIYSDTSTTVRNRGIFCSMQAIRADNIEYADTQIPCKVDWSLNTQYEDA